MRGVIGQSDDLMRKKMGTPHINAGMADIKHGTSSSPKMSAEYYSRNQRTKLPSHNKSPETNMQVAQQVLASS